MKTNVESQPFPLPGGVSYHPITAEDKIAMTALRTIIEPNKGRFHGTAARAPYDAIMERVAAPEGVTFEEGVVGNIPGWWCRPESARPGAVILHLHGGWFNWGSAKAFRHLVGHLALHAGAVAFVPDYRLAPEEPFPAASEDAFASYTGLVDLGFTSIAVTGDSAGGNLALGLLISLRATNFTSGVVPIAAVALSPVTDLSLTSASWTARADVEPYFTHAQVTELVSTYLRGAAPQAPAASPLQADLRDLPPIRVHVGEDEVLLDDSVNFVKRALEAGVDARLDVWQGMVHGFLGGVGRLTASTQALQHIGSFLSERFAAPIR